MFVIAMVFLALMVKYYYPEVFKIREPEYSTDQHNSFPALQKEVAALSVSHNNGSETAQTIPLLVYHGVTPDGSDGTITIDRFKQHLFALKEAGFETVSLADLDAFLKGEKTLPAKSFLLTFDDGRKDSYYNTDLILRALDYEAVMFVIAKYSVENNHRYYLNQREIKEMLLSGRWEIGSHSYNGHTTIPIDSKGNRNSFFGNKIWFGDLNRLETDEEFLTRIRTDLLKAKALEERAFGVPINAFALPFSDFGQFYSNDENVFLIMDDQLRSNFSLVFYQFKPIANRDFRANYPNPSQSMHYVIRISVYPEDPPEKILQQIQASDAVALPYAEQFDNPFRWIENWGHFSLEDNALVLESDENAASGLVYIDGSYLWTDYSFSAQISSSPDQVVWQLARYQNPERYYACVFRNNQVEIVLQYDETFRRLRQSVIPQELQVTPPTPQTVSTKVDPSTVYCSVNGVEVARANHFGVLDHGGIGFRVHNATGDFVARQIEVK